MYYERSVLLLSRRTKGRDRQVRAPRQMLVRYTLETNRHCEQFHLGHTTALRPLHDTAPLSSLLEAQRLFLPCNDALRANGRQIITCAAPARLRRAPLNG